MNDFEATRELAHTFISEHYIESPCITIARIIDIVQAFGFKVFDYKEGNDLIGELKQTEKKHLAGFTYDKEVKYIFYDNTLPEYVQHEVLLHEMAHVYMKYSGHCNLIPGQKEKGIRQLALQINSPMCVLKKYKPKNVKEIVSLAKITEEKAQIIWEYLDKYKITPEDEPILNQFRYFLGVRLSNKFTFLISLLSAALTACFMYLIYSLVELF